MQGTLLDPDRLADCIGRRPLVAVLPFSTRSEDPAMRLLADEIGDALRRRLELDPALQSILISSDFLDQAPPHALELVCRELRVGHVLSGKCHGPAAAPSVYVELTDTRDWHVRWARVYREQARDLLADAGDAPADLLAALRRLVTHPACR